MKYIVHKNGRVFSFKNGIYKEKKVTIVNGFYPKTCFFNKGKRKDVLIHRLIAQAYIPNPQNKPCINHINGIKKDNRIENLEWCTYQENTRHSIANGLQKLGHRGGCLSWDSYERRWASDITHHGVKYRKVSKNKKIIESWMKNLLKKLGDNHV